MKTAISDYDKFQLSKYYPGNYHNDSVYNAGTEVAASLPLTSGINVSKCFDWSNAVAPNNSPLGTRPYTVIMF
jgi:hypothetical protein